MNHLINIPRQTPADCLSDEHRAVYTVIEAAQLLSLSRGSAYALVRNGTIPAIRMGNRWVIPKRRFHSWLDGTPESEAN
ncbi:helix-turn-helix domain-containing protein [Nonomuraea dietziae]|uniref:helix-turn-helix domain-containing protein n=1 Tax=Nonomuraea dietziae TaxID=65515 RepID=UPI00343BC4D0